MALHCAQALGVKLCRRRPIGTASPSTREAGGRNAWPHLTSHPTSSPSCQAGVHFPKMTLSSTPWIPRLCVSAPSPARRSTSACLGGVRPHVGREHVAGAQGDLIKTARVPGAWLLAWFLPGQEQEARTCGPVCGQRTPSVNSPWGAEGPRYSVNRLLGPFP